MESMDSHIEPHDPPTLEVDPADVFAEDQEIDEAWEEKDDEIFVENEERIVPLDEEDQPASGGLGGVVAE